MPQETLDQIRPEQPPQVDTSAQESDELFNREGRHLHRVFLFVLWAISISFVSGFLILLLHYLLPPSCRWLSESDVSRLKDMVISGAVGGVVTEFAKQTIAKHRKT